jgi:hypothetical protein
MIKDGCLIFTMSQLIDGIGVNIDVRNTQATREISSILTVKLGVEKIKKTTRVNGVPSRIYSLPLQ